MPPENNTNNLSKYFTWEFIKILIIACGILGGFFEMKTEIEAIKNEFRHISETMNEMKSTMNKKFEIYDEEIKEIYKLK
ncbi:MAG: hypothetical protein JSS63_02450 [Bacteroidetes bacterium]|nr:hypothetical protein [Bacteroidota bacterium]